MPKKEGVEKSIIEILIPKETVKQVKNGKVHEIEKKLYPGYIYLHVDLTDQILKIIREIPRVSGFLGASKSDIGRKKPLPVPEKEIAKIKDVVTNREEKNASGIQFEVGEKVIVTDGPFDTFSGFVKEIDIERQRLKLSISIFNRETPVELEYHQVKKVS